MSPVHPDQLASMAKKRGGPIEDDQACAYCGYNVRGLHVGRACPECGRAITKAYSRLEHLMDAPPAYLAKIRWGMVCITLGLILPLAALVAEYMLELDGIILSLAGLSSAVLGLAGGFILTAPRPDMDPSLRTWTSFPVLTRYALVGSAVFELLDVLTGGRVDGLIALIATIVSWSSFGMMCWVFAGFAAWAKHDSLERHFQIVFWMIMLPIALLMFDAMASTVINSPISACGCVFAVSLLVGAVWYVFNIIRLMLTLQTAVRDKDSHDYSMRRKV